jgi:hypothetical protein
MLQPEENQQPIQQQHSEIILTQEELETQLAQLEYRNKEINNLRLELIRAYKKGEDFFELYLSEFYGDYRIEELLSQIIKRKLLIELDNKNFNIEFAKVLKFLNFSLAPIAVCLMTYICNIDFRVPEVTKVSLTVLVMLNAFLISVELTIKNLSKPLNDQALHNIIRELATTITNQKYQLEPQSKSNNRTDIQEQE